MRISTLQDFDDDNAYHLQRNIDRNGNKLYKYDAKVVHIAHTNTGQFGYAGPLGDIDFYFNDGSAQPECPTGITQSCSHTFPYKLLISLNKKANLLKADRN